MSHCNSLFIFTHHKTGTKYWGKVARNICSIHSIEFYRVSNTLTQSQYQDLKQHKAIILCTHSLRGDIDVIDQDTSYILHSVRNAPELILSSIAYNSKSNEAWLHKNKKKFGGLSYQQKLKSLDSLEEKIIFELENSAGNGLLRVQKIIRSRMPRLFNINLDDVSSDKRMFSLINAFYFLQLQDLSIPLDSWLNVCKKQCLWNNPNAAAGHSTSNINSQEDLRKSFTTKAIRKFNEVLGDELTFATFGI